MGWKNWPSWLKGGLIGGIIFIILFVISLIFPQILFLYDALDVYRLESITGLITTLISYFVAGVIIGGIIGKFFK